VKIWRSSPACSGARPRPAAALVPGSRGRRRSERARARASDEARERWRRRSARQEEATTNRAREEEEPANRRAQSSFSPPEFLVDPPESLRPVPSVIWSALTDLGAFFALEYFRALDGEGRVDWRLRGTR
jgi:hypothetical protein